MEEKVAAEQVHKQEQINEEESDAVQNYVREVENREEKADGIEVEKPQIPKEIEEEKNESKAETAIDDNKQSQAKKVGGNQADITKKPKQAPKQIPKMKITVPQPFSLATDKRMSRERRASVDFKDQQLPKLSKSASVNYKVQSSPSAKDLVASELKRSATTASNSRPRVTSTKTDDKKVEKNQAEESETNKLRKNSTFKTLPLPSFIRRKESTSKPDIKKVPTTGPRSALPGRQGHKSISDAEKNKTKNIGKNTVSRTISSSAKETISKLIKGTRKALNPSKETVKSVVSIA
ncbi:PREDICTED: uncharacterized protein LOC105121553 isoform X2 [Populus euphratica]|uniref:Uncharacterized protein LOC105121553 isoform X2 n=1 Tax=Populus euphratica TaxID=75702 RepID=A0AAJ6TW04_POPEU|nr:PREDICTED: uncharacterized protein LOC105121553 isoform X2 [Populus euphratica]